MSIFPFVPGAWFGSANEQDEASEQWPDVIEKKRGKRSYVCLIDLKNV
jgi:hypothetical protein